MNHSELRVFGPITLVVALVAAGFFFMFEKIASLETALKNHELQGVIGNSPSPVNIPQPPSIAVGEPNPSAPSSSSAPAATPTIDTAIITLVLSSAKLQPQTALTLSVERVSRAADGTLTAAIKVFTNAATAYSAFDADENIQLLDVESGQSFTGVADGPLASIPPKSSAAGAVIFKTDPARNTLILQIGNNNGNGAKYYEFNFSNLTYREVEVG